MKKTTILVVEDEFITSADIQNSLQQMGYDVPVVVDTGEDAVKMAGEMSPDIVLMNISLKGEMNGIQAAEQIRERYGIPVIYLTGHSDNATLEKATSSEPFGYLIKPLEERTLGATIQMALYKHSMDEKLRQSEETNRALLNASTNEVVLIDKEGRILALNNALAQRAGKPIDELKNTIVYDLIKNGVFSVRFGEEFSKALLGEPGRFEEEFQGMWLLHDIYPITDKWGGVVQIAMYCYDITDIRRTKKELEEANDQLNTEKNRLVEFQHALDTMDDYIIITDPWGNINYVNESFVKRFGYELNDVINKYIGELKSPDNEFMIGKDTFSEREKKVWSGRFIAKNAYGMNINTQLKSSPIFTNEKVTSRIFVLREMI